MSNYHLLKLLILIFLADRAKAIYTSLPSYQNYHKLFQSASFYFKKLMCKSFARRVRQMKKLFSSFFEDQFNYAT